MNSNTSKRVLDPCSGSRVFYFDRHHPDVIFGDNRTETHTLCDGRQLHISPDVNLDVTALPFSDGQFKLVIFDPPHLLRAGPKSWIAAKYGKLPGNWKEMLRKGFKECFRVLSDNGVLVFKWSEIQITAREVLACSEHMPLVGNKMGKQSGTHWYIFMKPN
ncbi:MAG: SAM-dependent methyltransferase [Magnetococcales bacterium]|nr:SAM-dependent methyltransferase [Magnetococcales bacterium]